MILRFKSNANAQRIGGPGSGADAVEAPVASAVSVVGSSEGDWATAELTENLKATRSKKKAVPSNLKFQNADV